MKVGIGHHVVTEYGPNTGLVGIITRVEPVGRQGTKRIWVDEGLAQRCTGIPVDQRVGYTAHVYPDGNAHIVSYSPYTGRWTKVGQVKISRL